MAYWQKAALGNSGRLDIDAGGAANVRVLSPKFYLGGVAAAALGFGVTVNVPAWSALEGAALDIDFANRRVLASRTNHVRNSSMQGAAAPSTLPTNWTIGFNGSGLTSTVVGIGTENGLEYVDIRISGTSGSTTEFYFGLDGSTQIVAATGQSWTNSLYAKVVAGALPSGQFRLRLNERTALNASVATGNSSDLKATVAAAGSTLARYTFPYTLAGGGTTERVWPMLAVGHGAEAVDVTLRIAAPQCEQTLVATPFIRTTTAAVTVTDTHSSTIESLVSCTRASVGYAENSGGVWSEFAANVLRVTDKGVLIEESRTNSIRNNSMQGAVAGVPGTAPTNWVATASPVGLTRTIVGTGTENGVEYIEIRFQGFPNASGQAPLLAFEASTQIAALPAQVWASSVFCKLVSGDLTNVTLPVLKIAERDVGGSLLASGDTTLSIGSTLVRTTGSRTLTHASTVFVDLSVRVNLTISAAVDFTIRIGWPQMELGSFATSPIRTTTAAATRAADVVKTGSIAWLNASAGTVYGEGGPSYTAAQGVSTHLPCLVSLDDTTTNERIQLRRTNDSSGRSSAIIVDGAAVQASLPSATGLWPDASSHKLAVAYAANDAAFYDNASQIGTDATVTIPTPTQCQFGNGAGLNYLNGYLKRFGYAISRRTNAETQAWTV